jgi:hypothetical protein
MALTKQLMPLSFNGINQKTDEKVLPAGSLVNLQNAIVNTIPTIEKRKGYDKLNGISFDALYTANRQLLAISNNSLYFYSDSTNTFNQRGLAPSVNTSATTIASNLSNHSAQDALISNNIRVLAYLQGADLYIATQNTQDGGYIIAPTLIEATIADFRLVVSGEFFWVVYRSGTNIKSYSGSVLVGTPTLVTITTCTAKPIDACAVGANCAFAYVTSGATYVAYITPGNVLGSPALGLQSPTATSILHDKAVAIWSGVDEFGIKTISVFGADAASTTVSHIVLFAGDLSSKLTAYNVAVPTGAVRLSGFTLPVSTTFTDIFMWDYRVTAIDEQYEISSRSRVYGGATTAQPKIYTASILSSPVQYDNKVYFYVCYSSASNLQPTVFLYNFTDSLIMSRLLPSSGPKLSAHVHTTFVDGSTISSAIPKKTRQTTSSVIENTVLASTVLGVQCDFLDYLDTLVICSGFPQFYDGVRVVEAGFHLFPEKASVVQAATGGSMSDGVYLYTYIYEWIDANGRVQRSAPSEPVSITVNGGGTSQKVTLTLQNLFLTSKPATDILLSVFRTQAGGTIYYKVTDEITAPVRNSNSAYTQAFIDTLADATAASRELLYTTGGIFENTSIPSGSVISKYKNRIMVTGGECGSRVYYTKPVNPGVAPEFTDLLFKEVSSESNPTAITELDDKCLIFTENRCYVVVGEPADGTGANNSLSTPQPLPSDAGCVSSKSLALLPNGVIYQSLKGIWQIDRGLNSSYIGAPVEKYGMESVVGFAVSSTQNKLFLSQANQTIVYDYFLNMWSTFTGMPSTGALSWRDKHVYLHTDKSIRVQNDGYNDADSPYSTVIESGWISFAGVQGYQRLYSLLFLGENVGSHYLKVEMSYNFADIVSDVFYVNGDSVKNVEFGGEPLFGGGVYGGSEDGVYQFQLKPRIQRCESFKFKISDLFPSGEPTGGFKLTSVACEVAQVKSSWSLQSGRRLV